MSQASNNGEKRPYARPSLTSYGDIRSITMTVGKLGALDTGATPNKLNSKP